MKRKIKLFYIPLMCLSICLTACPFSFGDNGEWKKKYGTPELLLENARDEAYVYLYENQNQYKDNGNIIRDAIKEVSPFIESGASNINKDLRYFTYEAIWMAATSGPNYEHLSIYENGVVRIDHKTSLGPHEYLYFSLSEEKATALVDFVFTKISA